MPAFGIDRSLSSNKFSALLLAVISEAGNQLLGGYAGIAQILGGCRRRFIVQWNCNGKLFGIRWMTHANVTALLPYCFVSELGQSADQLVPEMTGSRRFIELRQHCQPELRWDREFPRRGFPCPRGPVRLLRGCWRALRKRSFPGSSIPGEEDTQQRSRHTPRPVREDIEVVGTIVDILAERIWHHKAVCRHRQSLRLAGHIGAASIGFAKNLDGFEGRPEHTVHHRRRRISQVFQASRDSALQVMHLAKFLAAERFILVGKRLSLQPRPDHVRQPACRRRPVNIPAIVFLLQNEPRFLQVLCNGSLV